MSNIIDEIVQISITRQTAVAQVASFNGVMIVGEFLIVSITPAFTERVRTYSSLSEIAAAGFSTSGPIYLAAQSLFAQNPNIGEIYVGRKKTGGDGTETWTECLNAIILEDDTWYGLMAGTRTLADLQEIADWAESNKKLYITSDDDANIIDSTGDIAEYVNTNNYDRTAVLYHDEADFSATDPWAEAAWFGLMFTKDPGSATWMFKTLAGVAAYSLTTTQINTALGKECNLYQEIAGVAVTREGTVGSGEYIDVIRGIDWLEARIQERVYTVFINNDKVPFTDAGIQSVVSELSAALQEAVDNNLITQDYTVNAPLASEVSSTDKGNRTLPDITFQATLAGAIHKVQIEGIVAL